MLYMEGVVVHFRQGRHHVKPKQVIIKVADNAQEAQNFIDKKVIWKSPAGKEIIGQITALHGKNGCVRALFKDKGLPGQALGKKVTIN